MKRIILILAILIFCTSAHATQTITDLNTNSPVALGELLTINGNYNDTDSNSSVFCKFLIRDANSVIERLTDERTFPNGAFYAQRRIQEPLYKRGEFYIITTTCQLIEADTNFTVGQRESIEHIATEEFKYFFDRENVDTFYIIGSIVFFFVIVVFVVRFQVQQTRRF